MRSSILLIIGLCAVLSQATQYNPIGKYGLSIGDIVGSSVHVQAFYDLLCPDSKDSNSILNDVFKTVILTKRGIKFTYNFFPLPYHYYALKLQAGFNFVRSKYGDSMALNYLEFVFSNQDALAEQKWKNKTTNQFITEVSTWVGTQLRVDQAGLAASMNTDSEFYRATIYEWKYCGGSLGISGTPIFYANGVRIDGAEDWKYGQWLQFFNSFLGEQTKTQALTVQ